MSHDRIQSRPEVMMGKPVIRGTRITVEHILRKLSDGWSVVDICTSYPHIKPQDVQAALEFAADNLAHPTVWAAE
jgi:uncharacterized protein (DUF433 family)